MTTTGDADVVVDVVPLTVDSVDVGVSLDAADSIDRMTSVDSVGADSGVAVGSVDRLDAGSAVGASAAHEIATSDPVAADDIAAEFPDSAPAPIASTSTTRRDFIVHPLHVLGSDEPR